MLKMYYTKLILEIRKAYYRIYRPSVATSAFAVHYTKFC